MQPGEAMADAFLARSILRAGRMATLATAAGGQPFAALVTPAFLPDLTALLLLSSLSEHTRHLQAERRVALLVVGEPTEANPQTAPRVTLTGLAEPIAADGVAKARYLARHPYAALYADFGDFSLWRIVPQAALFVGGFARAVRLRRATLLPDPASVAAIQAAEADILSHCNARHPDALATLAARPGAWRMVAVDTDGCDLAENDTVLRIPWSKPASGPADIRSELLAMIGKAPA